MSKKPPLWTLSGYVSEANTRLVQDWFDSLPVEEHEELKDTLNYLVNISNWRRPEFDKVTPPLHEIRCKANQKNHEIRIYGTFDKVIRKRFVMLAWNECKKKDNDEVTQKLALKRLALVEQGKASTHEFVIEKEPDRENLQGQGKPLAPRLVKR